MGYLHNQLFVDPKGPRNFNLRFALSRKLVDPSELKVEGEQYDSFDEMVIANYEEYEGSRTSE